MDITDSKEPNFFEKFGLEVATGEVEVGQTYPIYGMITKVLDETPGITKNWNFTSDSIAAWLALELKADALFLVKSVVLDRHDRVLASLSNKGLIDCCMENRCAAVGVKARVCQTLVRRARPA